MEDTSIVLFGKLLKLQAKMNGMIATNKIQELRQEYPNYNEGDFQHLEGEIQEIITLIEIIK